MKELNKFLQSINGGKVLDIASGAGQFINFIKGFKSYKTITATDLDFKPGSTKNFENDKTVVFKKMDATNLQFDENSFDTVCISNSLHHFKKPLDVLKQMKKVVKSQTGLIIVNEMVCDDLSKAQQSHAMLHHWTAKYDMANNRFHNKTYTKAELVNIVKQGLQQEVKYFTYSFPANDVFDEKLINHLYKIIDSFIANMKKQDFDEEIILEGNKIKEYIKQNGYASATSILIYK